jgi:hypothetical protein
MTITNVPVVVELIDLSQLCFMFITGRYVFTRSTTPPPRLLKTSQNPVAHTENILLSTTIYPSHDGHIEHLILQIQHGRPYALIANAIPPYRQPAQSNDLPSARIPEHVEYLQYTPLIGILDAYLLRLAANVLSLDVRMIAIPRLDDDGDMRIVNGEVQEMGRGR